MLHPSCGLSVILGAPGGRIFQETAPKNSTGPCGYCTLLGSPRAPALLQEPRRGPASVGVRSQRGKNGLAMCRLVSISRDLPNPISPCWEPSAGDAAKQ